MQLQVTANPTEGQHGGPKPARSSLHFQASITKAPIASRPTFASPLSSPAGRRKRQAHVPAVGLHKGRQ